MRSPHSPWPWIQSTLLVAVLCAGPLAAQDGELDPRLSADGRWTWFTSGFGSLTAATPLSGGGVGWAGSYDSPFSWHFNATEMFINGTQLTFDFSADGAIAALDVEDMGEDGAGRVVLAGTVLVGPNAYRPALARITQLSDGSGGWNFALDSSFDGDGRRIGPAPPAGWAVDNINAALVLSDGRSLFTGSCTGCLGAGTHGAFVVRLTAAGAADSSFSGDGWFAFAVAGSSVTEPHAMTAAFAGAVLVAGQTTTPSILSFVARITSAGALDPVINNNAVGFYELTSGATGTATAVAFDPDTGKAVIARGASGTIAGGALLGFNALGQVESTFGTSGVLDLDIEEGARLDAVEYQSDGKIVAAGTIDANGSQPAGFYMVRTLANGVLDPTFDGNGLKRVEFDEMTEGLDYAHSTTLFGGRLVVVGEAEMDIEGQGSNLAALQLTSALILTDGFESGTTVHWSKVLP